MADPTEIAATLLAYGRGKQDRSPRFHPRLDERRADRDERSQTARVVGDAGTLESRAVARHRHIQFGTEHGIEVRGEHDGSVVWGRSMLRPYVASIVSIPPAHIPDLVNLHIRQSSLAQHFRHPRAARPFRPGWRGNRGERSLAAERRFVGALDVRARGAHALIEEDGVDHVSKL